MIKIDNPFIKGDGVIKPRVATDKMGVNSIESLVDSTPITDQLLNGGFEDWTVVEVPSSWTVEFAAEQYPTIEKSTDKYAGTYALLLPVVYNLSEGVNISDTIEQAITTAGEDTIQLKAYVKRSSGTPDLLYYYYYEDGEDLYYYNFTGENVGTWTIAAEGPSSDQLATLSATDSYAQVAGAIATIPEGVLSVWAGYASVGTIGHELLVDNVEILNNGVDEAVNGTFETWENSAYELLDDWDFGEIAYVSGDHSTIEKEAVVVQAGLAAVKMTLNNDSSPYVAQLLSKVRGDSANFSIFSRKATSENAVSLEVFVYDDVLATATKMWDFVLGTWVAIGGGPGADQKITTVLSDSYVEITDSFEFPETNKAYIWVVGRSESMGEIVYVDTASTKENFEPIFEATTDIESGDIEGTQKIIKFSLGNSNVFVVFADGSGKCGALEWDDDGNVTSGTP